ncbi:MAG: MBL fold metallo-hydrolase, partial [Candidatus Omnitrophica bacterium]|nr:MBL fold metallo-hydrolase [Candidatus Omnitrophota bacterium]
GDRVHEHKDVSLEKLRKVINETKDRGGNVIIPAFAIERVQEILYYLNQLVRDGDIPPLKTFVDSPMAADVTRVFTKSVDFYDEESLAILRQHQSLFDSSFLRMTKSVEDSKAINDVKEPVIIMAGSGMCTGGRIKHHLVKHISRPENTILFVGYQAFGTLGRQILEKPERVRILGETYPVKARIEVINGFSGHADKEELLEWIGHMSSKPEKVFIVHSEEKTAERFAETLRTEKGFEVIVPQYQQRVAIGDV